MMKWIIIVITSMQFVGLQGDCPVRCVCDSGSDVCVSCEQWYTRLSHDCHKVINIGPFDFKKISIPDIKSSTKTTIKGIFAQAFYVDTELQLYYYYVVQFRTGQDASFTDGTRPIQNLPKEQGPNAKRTFVIDGLQKNTEYQIRMVLYRGQNDIFQEIAVTESRPGTTACSDQSKPTGFFASSGRGSFKIHWDNLFYDPSCEHAVVDVHFTNVDNLLGLGESRIIPDADVANNPGSYTVINVQAASYNVYITVKNSNSSVVVHSDTVSVNVTDSPYPAETPSTNDLSKTFHQPNAVNCPTPIPTADNNPTSQPTNDNSPNCSGTSNNSDLVIPVAILSVIVLLLVVLLVVSFCCNVKLRRRPKGIKTDSTGEATMPIPWAQSATSGTVSNLGTNNGSVSANMHPTLYYNSAAGEAVTAEPGTGGSVHGGSLYREVEESRVDKSDNYSGYEEPQDSSYEAMQQQANYHNLPAPPAVYQEF